MEHRQPACEINHAGFNEGVARRLFSVHWRVYVEVRIIRHLRPSPSVFGTQPNPVMSGICDGGEHRGAEAAVCVCITTAPRAINVMHTHTATLITGAGVGGADHAVAVVVGGGGGGGGAGGGG
eukprot:SAG11_NODE_7202_length_1178_cov_1.767377_3_plen_122_part_01